MQVVEQWGLYDGYDPKLEKVLRRRRTGRHMPIMNVIPPGLDFSNLKVHLRALHCRCPIHAKDVCPTHSHSNDCLPLGPVSGIKQNTQGLRRSLQWPHFLHFLLRHLLCCLPVTTLLREVNI